MKRFAVMLAASALFPAALFGATRSDYLDIVESAVENLGKIWGGKSGVGP